MCVTTTGSLNSNKEHGDNTGLVVRDSIKWGGAPENNQDDDIVWSACIKEDAEFGRNDQVLDSMIFQLEQKTKKLGKTLQELYNELLNNSNLKGTGLERLIQFFDYSKRDIKIIRKEMYLNNYILESEDVRRAKISLKMVKVRLEESDIDYKKRINKCKETKSSWTQKQWEHTYGKKSIRNKNIAYRKKKFLASGHIEAKKQIKRFMNAPKYAKNKPNKVEKNVCNLNTSLYYTGNGSYFTTLVFENGEFWHKNPDFIYKPIYKKRAKAVVEIMDFEYWHTITEAQKLIELYNKAGIQCLIIDAKRCYKKEDLMDVELQINNFLQNI